MDIKMVYGEATTALSNPNTIVISETIAEKHFKGQNPVGRSIYLSGSDTPYKITAVMQDFASNSHLNYDFLITLKDVEFSPGEQTRWAQNNYFTYIKLKQGIDVAVFEKKMSNTLLERYLIPAFKAIGYDVSGDKLKLFLQPLADINLYSSHIDFEAGLRNDIKVIWIFTIVALFILVIASINFVNLSTAKSANRAKEVGMRKVVGSTRKQLIGQFLAESILISMIAFVVGGVLAALFMPVFRTMSGIDLIIPWLSFGFIPTLMVTSLLAGVMAGLYPAFYLSRFNPVSVLKGKLSSGKTSSGLRSSLVVFQFTISIILIVSTLIINQQMNFILNSKVGFEKDQVLQIYSTNALGDKIGTFKNELKNISGVSNVSVSDFIPVNEGKRNGTSFEKVGEGNDTEKVFGQTWTVDEGYIETMGMNLIAGRDFILGRQSDLQAVIVNQAMVKALHIEKPIGGKISIWGQDLEIIGVVEDFNFNSMKESVRPLSLRWGISPAITSVKMSTADVSSVLADIESKWNEFVPNMAFRYKFMDDSFESMYEDVTRIKSIFTTFAILAILIACLGLLALSAYMVEQRNKEMSIRKVLGASVQTIFKLLTRNFVLLIVIALVLAIPVAYYMMDIWLQDYEYSIEISWTVFVFAAVISILIAVLTISYHAIKSALIDPAKILRNE